jgi:hypothetical protein
VDLIDLKHELLLFDIIRPDDKIQFRVEAKLKRLPELRQLIIDQTQFLKYDAPLKTRIYCVILNIKRQPVCEICDSVLKMRMDGKFRYTFARTCGAKCHCHLPDVKKKRRNTNIEKYGVSNVLTSDYVAEIRKERNLRELGVENAFSSPIIREQIKQDNIKKYGVENISGLTHVKEKRKNTMVERYGVENAIQSPEIRQKMIDTNVERYGVENVWLSEEIQQRRFDTMKEKYGVEYPLQNDDIKQKFTDTMKEKHGVEHAQQKHITDDALLKTRDVKWLTEQHHNNKKPISKIAAELGYSQSGLYPIFDKLDIETHLYHQSTGEIELYELIKSIIPDAEIIQSDRIILDGEELDIYIPSLNLAFEYNGIYCHSDLAGKDRRYHLSKTKRCNDLGIRLIHIWDREWILNQSIVISRINNLLGMSDVIYARKCIIVMPTKEEVKLFMDLYHIQGNVGYSVAYGLEYEGRLVNVITFGKSRYTSKYEYELIRYVNILNCSVVGGASKLFKRFVKDHKPQSIVTYSDRRWNTGKLYEKLGFSFSNNADPNYFYFKLDSFELSSRQSFQKHKLKKKLDIFDPQLTEWENMQVNGYNRIWDCGNGVYIWSC